MKISVIICTYNRAHTIIDCLDSIAAALCNAAPLEAEIVVVDNASTDNTSALVRKWSTSCAFPVQLLRETKNGLGPARNCGIRSARGDLLVFTDDDCRLAPDYIQDALRHDANDTEAVLRGGRVELGDPTDLPITIKTETNPGRWSRQMRSARHVDLSSTIVGCNVAVRKKTVDRIGMFDERFGAGTNIPAGEDTDYIYRAYLADVTIEYVPDMAVFHHHGRKSVTQAINLFRNYTIGAGALYTKYVFKDFDILRPVFWDLKNLLREALQGKADSSLPSFSFWQKLALYGIGSVRYCAMILKKPVLGPIFPEKTSCAEAVAVIFACSLDWGESARFDRLYAELQSLPAEQLVHMASDESGFLNIKLDNSDSKDADRRRSSPRKSSSVDMSAPTR